MTGALEQRRISKPPSNAAENTNPKRTRLIVPTILVRVGSGLLVMWAAATVAYAVLHSMPGRIEDILAGVQVYPGLREAIAAEWGLDKPPLEQYMNYLLRLAHGDLGTSYLLRQPVAEVVGSQLGATVTLALVATVIAVLAAITMATATAGRSSWLRSTASTAELVATSVPVFWVGILLLMAFSFGLKWFPVAGGTGVQSLVLPAITLAIPTAGILSQVLRESLERTLEQPFIMTARSRGIGEALVRVRHGLKHAALPAVTLGGWLIGSMLGGAVITEQVFGRPGLGSVMLIAVTNKDIPVVLAVVLLAGLVYVLISTLVDVLYQIIDPRLRTGA